MATPDVAAKALADALRRRGRQTRFLLKHFQWLKQCPPLARVAIWSYRAALAASRDDRPAIEFARRVIRRARRAATEFRDTIARRRHEYRRRHVIWASFSPEELSGSRSALLAMRAPSPKSIAQLSRLVQRHHFTGELLIDVLEPGIWGAGISALTLRKLREGHTDVDVESLLFEASARFRRWLEEILSDIRYRGTPLVQLGRVFIAERDFFYRRLGAALTPLLDRRQLVVMPTPAYTSYRTWLQILRIFADNPAGPVRFLDGRRFRRRFPAASLRHRDAVLSSPEAVAARAGEVADQMRAAATGPRPVVIVAGGAPGSHYWAGMEQVALACRDSDVAYVVLVADQMAWLACQEKNIAVLLLPGELLTTAGHEAVLREWDVALGRVFSQLKSRQPPCDRAMLALLAELRRSAALRDWLMHGLSWLDLLGAVFAALAPRSVVILPHWSQAGHHAGEAARQLGIPRISFPVVTVAGNHASLVDWDVDLVCAYGTQCVEAFVAVGFPRDRLVLTGNPGFDQLLRYDRATGRAAVERQGIVSKRPRIVLVATSRADQNEPIWLQPLAAFCAARDDTQLIAKVHPSFPRVDYDSIAPSSDAYAVASGGSIWDFVAAADLCITDFSTAGAEALIAGTPLIVVNLTGKRFPCNNYDELGVAAYADSVEALLAAVTRLLDMPENHSEATTAQREAFLAAYNYGNDGGAAARIAQVLAAPKKYLPERRDVSEAPAR